MKKTITAYEQDKTAKFYVERFENYREFVDTLEKRKSEESKNDYEGGDLNSWHGVKSWDEAYGLLLKGWDKPVGHIEMNFNKSLVNAREKSRRRVYASVAGFSPIVPHAVMNLPNSMFDEKIEAKKTKVLDFLIMIDRACGNSASEIERRMSEQLAAIAVLERDYGYRCRISVSFASFSGSYRHNQTNVACVLKVKDESQPFDIKRLAFPIVHAGMLRALMFRWERTLSAEDGLNKKYSEYHASGMGTSYEKWNSSNKEQFVRMLSGNKSKVIVLDFDSKVEDVITKGTGKEVRVG